MKDRATRITVFLCVFFATSALTASGLEADPFMAFSLWFIGSACLYVAISEASTAGGDR